MRCADRRRAALALFALTTTLAAAGCGDSLPVEDRALIMAMGIDPVGASRADLDWTFVLPNVTATASNVGGLSPSAQVFDVRVRAPDLSTAQAKVQDMLTRRLYLGDLEALAVGLGTPSSRVRAVMADLVQLGDVPDSFVVVATPDPVSRLLTLVTRQDVIPRYFLTTYVNCQGCHRFDWRILGWRWWASSQTPGDVPRALVLRIKGSNLVVAGMAVYRSGPEPARVMTPDATDGLGYLTGRAAMAVVTGVVGGRRISITRVRDTARAIARLHGGRVAVAVNLRVRGTLTSQESLGDETVLVRTAQDLVARDVLHDVTAALRWANAERCDPFGYTAQALLAEPRLAYALPHGAEVWYPIDARVTVQAEVTSAGTAE